MEGHQSKYRGQVEISDLIDDAVNNAIARRYLAMNPEDTLMNLSVEEMKNVVGGISLCSLPRSLPGMMPYPNPQTI